MAEMEVFEAMHIARALRRLKPDPVPDELIEKIVDAGVRAPTGSNLQNWRFFVIKDAERRRRIGDIYRASMEIAGRAYMNRKPPVHMTKERQKTMLSAATHLAEHFGEVPVLILAWLQFTPDQENPNLPTDQMPTFLRLTGSSIFPAVQNMIVAASALGLGTVLTTVLAYKEEEMRKILGAPADMRLFAALPIGYPVEGYGHGPVRRLPLRDVTYLDNYGNNWPKS
ncbi:MAG TPA: nitroreductase family protein [Candidatus Binataceae bacterium]|nr:nitroreductase family protein [Candidatus Binataceae bacterium]